MVAGVLLRILQTATSLGTVDALLWYRWMELIEREGLLRSYLFSNWMNHPPLVLVIARATNELGKLLGYEFQDSFRALQLVADVITTFALVRIATRLGASARFVPLIFFLSPAGIFISAFHCNSDPLMTMLLVVSIALLLDERPVFAGVVFACAVGIKIVALLVLPLVFLSLAGRARVRFTIACAVTGVAIFLPGIVVSGPVFLRQVLFYSGVKSNWGWRLVFVHLGVDRLSSYLTPAMLLALAILWIAEWRRGAEVARLPLVTGVTYLIVVFFAPGFGMQYFFWLLPFLALLLHPRFALMMHGAISAYLFWYYTAWCGGWPWWYAETPAPPEVARPVVNAGLIVWAACGAAAVAGLRRLYAPRSDR